MNKRTLKEKLHEVIFEADTQAGKRFDIILLIFIVASVLVVMLETIEEIDARFHHLFIVLEWVFTVVFTIEYILRLYAVKRPIKYATSFYGMIDLLAILPTYVDVLFSGSRYLLAIRALRLLRIFRIFKLAKFLKESSIIMMSLRASRPKITVFLVFIFLVVIVTGSIMYFVEGGRGSGFTSIPKSIYWAIVTLTTVGYGDIHPVTNLGQLIAAVLMISGYAVLAVPTGIISAEVVHRKIYGKQEISTQVCRYCSEEGHDLDASHCKFCGELLNEEIE